MTASERLVPGQDSRFPVLAIAWRESRTARRRLLLHMSSISLGVAALVAIDSFAQNVVRSVREQSRSLFGGDITFESRTAWNQATDSLFSDLRRQGVTIAQTTSFASMALAPRTGKTRLVQVRAVPEGYPLYGQITTSPPGRWNQLESGRNAIADPALFLALGVSPGDSISIGYTRFQLLAQVASAPTRPAFTTALGPSLFIPSQYLADTKLLVTGSLASYDAYGRYTGDGQTLVNAQKPRLERLQVRATLLSREERNLTSGIGELSDFLGLVGIVALLLGGVGVASGVHAWVSRRIDTVAVLRCLGASSRQVLQIYVTQAAVMGLLGAAIGAALGIAIQFALPGAFRGLLPVDVHVRIEPRAVALGMSLGLWIGLAFAFRPLLALRRVSPLQALRRNEDPAPLSSGWTDTARLSVNLLIALSVVGLAATRSRTVMQTLLFSVAVGVALGALALSAASLSAVARRVLRRGWPYVVRQGVANLYRPGNQTRSVILALGFAAFLVTTLYLVQTNLLAQFKTMSLEARGNLVFFDVQDDQLKGLDSIAAASRSDVIERVPIVMMRVASINGRTPTEILSDSARRRDSWALRREFRSTYRGHMNPSEKIVAGAWFDSTAHKEGEPYNVSLESDVATSLRAKLGDTITWNVQGVDVVTRLTSLREVNWQRFEPNFFAVFEPMALERAPKMFALVLKTTGDTATALLQRDVVSRFPNVASIDLSQVSRTVNQISNRATLAIRFLALFSLAMAIPVLFSAVSATRRERVREGVLLKTLGATRRQMTRILFSEYALLGILGSLTGMVLSFGGAWLLLRFVFDHAFVPAFVPAAVIAILLLALTVAIGLLAGRDVFKETPMAALRDA